MTFASPVRSLESSETEFGQTWSSVAISEHQSGQDELVLYRLLQVTALT